MCWTYYLLLFCRIWKKLKNLRWQDPFSKIKFELDIWYFKVSAGFRDIEFCIGGCSGTEENLNWYRNLVTQYFFARLKMYTYKKMQNDFKACYV